MRVITLNLSYYNQTEVLRRHVLCWKSWPHALLEKFSFCIVDDASKLKAVEVLSDLDLGKLDLSIYRVQEDLKYNIAGVRNLAAEECKTEWMLITDMDTLVSEELAHQLLPLSRSKPTAWSRLMRKGVCYKFNRRVLGDPAHVKNNQLHPAVCLIRKEDYWKVGGCDEDLVGHYGQTDPVFWYRAKGKLKVIPKQKLYLDYIPEGESDIERDTSHNAKLFEDKKKTGNWSTDFVRFKWERVY